MSHCAASLGSKLRILSFTPGAVRSHRRVQSRKAMLHTHFQKIPLAAGWTMKEGYKSENRGISENALQ